MEVYGKTNIGLVRKLNEDNFFIKRINEDDLLAVVCDGMGGVNGGDVASKMAVDIISSEILQGYSENLSEKNIRDLISNAIVLANSDIFTYAEANSLIGMGTTAVVVLVCHDIVYIANVGDSRCYLLKKGNAIQVTEDHSVVQELVKMGKITKEEARVHPNKNFITRAVGAESKMIVDLIEIDFVKGDILVLCSDGLSNYIDDKSLGELSLKYRGNALLDNYIKIALDGGGKDNITVVTVEK